MKSEMTIKDVERVLRVLRAERKREDADEVKCSVASRHGPPQRIYSICLLEDQLAELENTVKLARRLLKQAEASA